MNNMKKIFLFSLSVVTSAVMMAQGAHDFKLNEIYVASSCCSMKVNCAGSDTLELSAEECQAMQDGYQDEYGEHPSWIEILNTSYSTHDIHSCYLTNDRRVLDKKMSVPERVKLMSLIPKGDARTSLSAKQRITFFADGHVNRGTLHASFILTEGEDNWVALYDGNGDTLLDSITVPSTVKAGQSYARIYNKEKDAYEWVIASGEDITPNASNAIGEKVEDNVAIWKQRDPHGLAMAVIAMGIVFVCLILLSVFFQFFGWLFNRIQMLNRVKAIRAFHEKAGRLVVMAKDGTETRGIEMENYAAAIGLALHEYMGNMHDVESGVITIEYHETEWADKSHLLRHMPVRRQSK